MGRRTQAALTVSASIAVILGGTVALARDQARGERVNGDDDPIIVSRSVSLPELANVHFLDPETTGSVLRDEARTRVRRAIKLPSSQTGQRRGSSKIGVEVSVDATAFSTTQLH